MHRRLPSYLSGESSKPLGGGAASENAVHPQDSSPAIFGDSCKSPVHLQFSPSFRRVGERNNGTPFKSSSLAKGGSMSSSTLAPQQTQISRTLFGDASQPQQSTVDTDSQLEPSVIRENGPTSHSSTEVVIPSSADNAAIKAEEEDIDAAAVDSFGFHLCTGKENTSFERFAKRRDNGQLCRLVQLHSSRLRWDAFYAKHGLAQPAPLASHLEIFKEHSDHHQQQKQQTKRKHSTFQNGQETGEGKEEDIDDGNIEVNELEPYAPIDVIYTNNEVSGRTSGDTTEAKKMRKKKEKCDKVVRINAPETLKTESDQPSVPGGDRGKRKSRRTLSCGAELNDIASLLLKQQEEEEGDEEEEENDVHDEEDEVDEIDEDDDEDYDGYDDEDIYDDVDTPEDRTFLPLPLEHVGEVDVTGRSTCSGSTSGQPQGRGLFCDKDDSLLPCESNQASTLGHDKDLPYHQLQQQQDSEDHAPASLFSSLNMNLAGLTDNDSPTLSAASLPSPSSSSNSSASSNEPPSVFDRKPSLSMLSLVSPLHPSDFVFSPTTQTKSPHHNHTTTNTTDASSAANGISRSRSNSAVSIGESHVSSCHTTTDECNNPVNTVNPTDSVRTPRNRSGSDASNSNRMRERSRSNSRGRTPSSTPHSSNRTPTRTPSRSGSTRSISSRSRSGSKGKVMTETERLHLMAMEYENIFSELGSSSSSSSSSFSSGASSRQVAEERLRLIERVGLDVRVRHAAWLAWSGGLELKRRAQQAYDEKKKDAVVNEKNGSEINNSITTTNVDKVDNQLSDTLLDGIDTPLHLLTYSQLMRRPLYSRALNELVTSDGDIVIDPTGSQRDQPYSLNHSISSSSVLSSISTSSSLSSSEQPPISRRRVVSPFFPCTPNDTPANITNNSNTTTSNATSITSTAASRAAYERMRRTLEQIDRDIARTTCQHPWLCTPPAHAPIRRVLSAYAYRNPSLGYLQSMNFLCAFLLIVLGPQHEEDVFWILAALVEDILPDHYTPRLKGLRILMSCFSELVRTETPWIAKQLDKTGSDVSFRSVSWFLCLFFTYLPPEAVVICWDVLFAHCSAVRATLSNDSKSQNTSVMSPSTSSSQEPLPLSSPSQDYRPMIGTYSAPPMLECPLQAGSPTRFGTSSSPTASSSSSSSSSSTSVVDPQEGMIGPVHARACAVLCCFGLGLMQEISLRLEKAGNSALQTSEILQTAGSYVVDAHRLASFSFTSHAIEHITHRVKDHFRTAAEEERASRLERERRRKELQAARVTSIPTTQGERTPQMKNGMNSSGTPTTKTNTPTNTGTPRHVRRPSRGTPLKSNNNNNSSNSGATNAPVPMTPSKKSSVLGSIMTPFKSLLSSLKGKGDKDKEKEKDKDKGRTQALSVRPPSSPSSYASPSLRHVASPGLTAPTPIIRVPTTPRGETPRHLTVSTSSSSSSSSSSTVTSPSPARPLRISFKHTTNPTSTSASLPHLPSPSASSACSVHGLSSPSTPPSSNSNTNNNTTNPTKSTPFKYSFRAPNSTISTPKPSLTTNTTNPSSSSSSSSSITSCNTPCARPLPTSSSLATSTPHTITTTKTPSSGKYRIAFSPTSHDAELDVDDDTPLDVDGAIHHKSVTIRTPHTKS